MLGAGFWTQGFKKDVDRILSGTKHPATHPTTD